MLVSGIFNKIFRVSGTNGKVMSFVSTEKEYCQHKDVKYLISFIEVLSSVTQVVLEI